jgi:hypothetical protein
MVGFKGVDEDLTSPGGSRTMLRLKQEFYGGHHERDRLEGRSLAPI